MHALIIQLLSLSLSLSLSPPPSLSLSLSLPLPPFLSPSPSLPPHTHTSNAPCLTWTACARIFFKAQNYLKYVSLVTLTFQNTLLIISMRYSRVLSGDMYFTTTAVLFSEFSKMVICLLIIFYQQRSNFLSHLHEAIIVNWMDTLKMSVPAIVYMLQNNLQYVAVSNLEAAVFQVSVSGL